MTARGPVKIQDHMIIFKTNSGKIKRIVITKILFKALDLYKINGKSDENVFERVFGVIFEIWHFC